MIFCTHFLIFLPSSVAVASMMKASEARTVERGDASFIRSAHVDVRAHIHSAHALLISLALLKLPDT